MTTACHTLCRSRRPGLSSSPSITNRPIWDSQPSPSANDRVAARCGSSLFPRISAEVYTAACQDCHGAAHTGQGRLTPLAPILPEVSQEYGELFPGVSPGLVFIEKVRHGRFFGVGGNMPPYSQEALSDQDLGALLAFLGL